MKYLMKVPSKLINDDLIQVGAVMISNWDNDDGYGICQGYSDFITKDATIEIDKNTYDYLYNIGREFLKHMTVLPIDLQEYIINKFGFKEEISEWYINVDK